MIVYRLCREDEIQQILNSQSFSEVGNFCRNNSERNTHHYDENIKYLHFFKTKTDLLYLNTLKGRYICVYDIPEELLLKHYGLGKYRDYVRFAHLNQVEEFAIPTNLIKFDYLQSIDRIIKDIDVEDFYEETQGHLEEVYCKALDIDKMTY